MSARHKRLAVAGVMLGLFLSALESTVVSTAMPTIVSSLGGLAIFSWVFSGYLLATTVSMPLWGRLSDFHGRKKLFLMGVVTFMAGSALCGLSRTMPQLIFFRFIQGIGAGAVMPLSFTIIGDLFSLEERARMQGLFSGVWGLASLVGPAVGGYLSDHASWRWIFYLNVPFGCLAIFLISLGLEHEDPAKFKKGALDVAGVASFAGVVFSLIIGFSLFSKSFVWGLPLVALSAALLILHFRLESRASHPVVPPSLFKIRMYASAQAAGLFTGMAMFGALSFVPLFMQSVLGSTATQAGRILLPFMLAWVTCSILAGRLLLRTGYRTVIVMGSSLLVCGFAFMLGLGLESPFWRVGLCMAMQGAGMGFVMAPFLIGVQNAVPRELMGAATSSTQFVRTVGGALGVAVMGAVLTRHLRHAAENLLGSPDPVSRVLGEVLNRPDSIVSRVGRAPLPLEILSLARTHMAEALHLVFAMGFLFALLALAASLAVPGGQARAHAWKPADDPPVRAD